ncbi:MAG: N-acetyl-gamma-glutamyl-phosphate reductase [Proteobacteria bacterium]|nr:N-acetyl-gamma-glutamyl-phosphate reductase [Pseudomonadota bacterium]MDA1059676.1 N-acetyl-gamma-glutamyl-phosphate reductase [Pseudomonadota bacterium]
MTNKKTIRVGILGASGYTGAELIRLLCRHPDVEIVLLTADRHAGLPVSDVFPHLFGLGLPNLIKIDEVEWHGVEADIIFCALPHGTTQEIVAGLLHHTGHDVIDELITERREDLIAGIPDGVRVIDLSADFRLENVDTYAQWYGHAHRAPQLQAEAVYGLTEFARDDIRDARLVACPGCYPTSALLPLIPLIGAGQIDADDIIIDAKSGVTGAGRAAKEASLFGEVSEGIHAYGVAGHRHGPEIEQGLAQAAGRDILVNFTPHLVPMNRGILSTIYVRLEGGATAADLHETLSKRYAAEPFVDVVPEGVSPATRHVRGSNHSLLGVFPDRVKGRAIILSVLDNLVKGASGQAVQNMNVMCGLPETLSLEQRPLFP